MPWQEIRFTMAMHGCRARLTARNASCQSPRKDMNMIALLSFCSRLCAKCPCDGSTSQRAPVPRTVALRYEAQGDMYSKFNQNEAYYRCSFGEESASQHNIAKAALLFWPPRRSRPPKNQLFWPVALKKNMFWRGLAAGKPPGN
jgi:hypothetical protein